LPNFDDGIDVVSEGRIENCLAPVLSAINMGWYEFRKGRVQQKKVWWLMDVFLG
jgi:hypothetical protein